MNGDTAQTTNHAQEATRVSAWERVHLIGVLLFIALMVFWPMGNGDFWAHAKVGEWILQHRAIPRHNLFMYTAPDFPWANHSWLSGVAWYVALRTSGVVGVQVFQLLLIALSWLVLWRLWKRCNAPDWLGIVCLTLAIGVSHYRFQPRPELLGMVGSSALLYLLFTVQEGNCRRLLWIPPLILLWTNFHGGVVFGLALLWLFTAGEAAQRYVFRRPSALQPTQLRWLACIALISSVATLVNPYGFRYFQAMNPERIQVFSQNILEWMSFPQFWRGLDSGSRAVLVAFAGAFLFSLIGGMKQMRLSHLLVVAFAALMTWQHLRNIWSLAQILVAVMACNFGGGTTGPARVSQRTRQAVTSLLLVTVAFASEYYLVLQRHWPGAGINRESLPLGAVRFIKEAPLQGNMYNDMLDAGYLIWSLCPERKLYVDILNAYGEDMFRESRQVSHNQNPQEVLNRRAVQYCIISEQNYFSQFARWLDFSPDWTLVYWDGISLIFAREGGCNQSVIDRYGYRLLHPTDPQRVSDEVAMLSQVQRGQYLGEVAAGLRNPVQTASLFAEAGTMLVATGVPMEAESAFRQALGIDAWHPRALLGLSQSLALQARNAESVQVLRKLLLVSPNKSKVRQLMDALSEESDH